MGFSDLAYLVGTLRDGSVFYDKAGRNYRSMWYEDNPKWLQSSVAALVVRVFDKAPRLEEYKTGHYRSVLYSKKAYDVFTGDFGFVSPQIKWGTPKPVREGSKEYVASYIAGFFDAEGDVSVGNYVVGISQKNYESLEFIRDWLIHRRSNAAGYSLLTKKPERTGS